MHWYVKAAAAHVLSRMPGGTTVHYWVQRYVTRTLPLPESDFRTRFAAAKGHITHYRKFAVSAPLERAVFMEFGAGWDLAIALVYAAAGVPTQVLLDIHALARADLVSLSVERIRRQAAEAPVVLSAAVTGGTGWAHEPDEREACVSSLPDGPASQELLLPWLNSVGIDYRAPGDARAAGLPDCSVDCITSTTTMEHIPAKDLASILAEAYRVLKPGGIVSCHVDMSDHFCHSDPSITPWNFLRFDDRTWNRIVPPSLYHNRLRASSHVELVRKAGFDIVREQPLYPRGVNIGTMPMPPVHPTFRQYRDRNDLLATQLLLVGRKPS